MRSFRSDARSGGDDAADRIVEVYESLWRSGEPSLDRYWAQIGSGSSPSVLAALVKIDLQGRFALKQCPRAADYLDRFPELTESGDRVVSIVYEEFCLLEESGANPDSREFCEAYGPWRDSLLSQLAYHRELSQVVGSEMPKVKFPQPGERFSTYHLRSVLGKGGVARVYLATEDDLGGRKVALKVSASVGREPAIMATLDHRNIVPILTVAESADGLRGICMPYRPGVTLEELIRRIGRGKPPPFARAIWDALKPEDASANLEPDDDRAGWKGFPVAGSFSEAVAWIGLALANALAYLHDRNVLHRDVKPANVLLSYREGPQVLDFNLAQDPKAPENVNAALKGGTLPYMAPEQLRAFVDPSRWDEVTSSADIYALGLVLQELVTGQPPDLPNANLPLPRAIHGLLDRRLIPPKPVREVNSAVPPALESIIARCLAVAPSTRYATASDLAEDLHRFLDRKPLKNAPNTSTVERAVNYYYRNRPLVAGVVLVLVMSLMVIRSRADRSVPDLTPFRQAVEDFHSGQPIRLERSRETFDQLRMDYPGSAWPRLYLALALEKIDKGVARANPFMVQACECSDAEEALRLCLDKEPKSASVRIAYGIVLAKKPPYEPALRALEGSIQMDPTRIMPYLELTKLERKLGLDDEALRHISQAIELGQNNASPKELYGWRTVQLSLLAKKVGRKFEAGSTPGDHLEGKAILNRLEASLASIGEDWRKMPEPSSGAFHALYENFYSGIAESSHAVIEADHKDGAKAKDFIDKARRHLDQAFDLVPIFGPDRGKIGASVKEQLREVDRRYRTLVAPLIEPPASTTAAR